MENEQNKNLLHIPSEVGNKKPKHKPSKCIIFQREKDKAEINSKIDITWEEAIKDAKPAECEKMNANDSIKRYSRQIILKEVGGQGQKLLMKSKVLIIGLGGLGSPVLQYLAASGVGTIGLADNDKVDLSNLHRQIIFSLKDIGSYKVSKAKKLPFNNCFR